MDLEQETPVYHKCGTALVKKSYKRIGRRLIAVGVILFLVQLHFARGTIVPSLSLLFFLIAGIYYLRKKPGFFYLCPQCRLKIHLEETDPAGE